MPAPDPSPQPARTGLLIVNADDWGMDARTTDAIADCFADGLVTSATAMVHMADSARAAARAAGAGLPLGLHLNLSEPYSATDVPEAARRLQGDLARRFGDRSRRLRRWAPGPGLRDAVDRCVREQLAAFTALYGRAPSHVDGHKHVQISPVVARAPALRGMALRRALENGPATAAPVAIARRARHRLTLAGHPGTDHFFGIAGMAAELRDGRVPGVLGVAHDATVEVMAHPGAPEERDLLRTPAWARALAGRRLGSFEDLR